jgi:hypothetical protein
VSDQSYWVLPDLSDYYLEDSWVLDVTARPGLLVLSLEVVLRETHAEHRPPKPGEQYCYRRARLIFPEVTTLAWSDQGREPARDASGEIDYGSVDALLVGDGRYSLFGDFGTIEISSAAPRIELAPEEA